MKPEARYTIVVESTLNLLIDRVNGLMNVGWSPVGPCQAIGDSGFVRYIQTLVFTDYKR